MATYYVKTTQEEIEAERFEEGNIDNFISFLSGECCSWVINSGKVAIVKFPFGHIKELIVLKGDYVVKGYEIPNTIPKPLHEFHVMTKNEFESNYLEIES